MKNKKIIIILVILALLVTCIFYLNYENTSLKVSNYEVINNKIPNEFNDFKIIQISDFHNTKSEKLTSRLIEELQKQKPNIIVFTGDLIDSYKTDIDTAINLIKEIKDIAPIYYVPGNHESRISDYSKLITEMKNHDAVILDNKVEVLELKGAKLNLLGIDDPSMAHGLYLSDREIVKTELNNLNYDKNNYSILLSHRPELFDMYAANKIDLVMTGHAHGGQIRVPFIGGLFAPNQGFFPKYTSGTFKEDKTTMIVSRGIGNSIMPFRINNRPELVVIELKNK